MTERIVVVGGGFGGLSFIRRLRALAPAAAVTLIDRNPDHTVLTEIHQVAAGSHPASAFRVPLTDLPGTRFIQAEVTGLDAENRRLLTSRGPVEYDRLVLAPGSVDTDYGVPGVARYALTLHSMAHAEAIAGRLAELAPGAPVVVAGGGLTGVELAAELAERLDGRNPVTLVEGAPTVLPAIGRVARRGAQARLGALGVAVLTGRRIVQAGPDLLHLDGGGAVPFSLLIWTAGVRANPLIAAVGLPADRAGRAIVNPDMATEIPGVYVIGDSAAGAPPTAQAASQQGAALAAHLAAGLAGRYVPVEPVHMKGTLIALGQATGAADLGRLQLAGLLPAVLKWANVARWLLTAAGWRTALRYLVGIQAPAPGRIGKARDA